MKTFAVLGLGRFGSALAMEMARSGVEVLAVDCLEKRVEQVADYVTQAMVADLTDEESLRSLGLHNVDGVAVCMSHSLEASIMCIMVSKELDVPHVVVKAGSRRNAEIYKKVGADKVIFPEEETGIRTAHMMMSSHFLQLHDISADMRLVEVKPKAEWLGKSLRELELRKRYGMNIVAMSDESGKVNIYIAPDQKITDKNLLWAIGSEDMMKTLE